MIQPNQWQQKAGLKKTVMESQKSQVKKKSTSDMGENKINIEEANIVRLEYYKLY